MSTSAAEFAKSPASRNRRSGIRGRRTLKVSTAPIALPRVVGRGVLEPPTVALAQLRALCDAMGMPRVSRTVMWLDAPVSVTQKWRSPPDI